MTSGKTSAPKSAASPKPKKPRVNSRNKGAVGERELSTFLQSHGFEARRGQQNKGGSDSPDVISNLPGVHVECKRTENLSIYPAVAQAIRDAGPNRVPTVWHRRNHKEWLVILRADDFINLLMPWVAS